MTTAESIGLEVAQLRRLELASIAEATTLLLLFGLAMPLKYLWGLDLAVRLMGPVHGLAFLAYIWTVLQTVAGGGWSRLEVVRLLSVAFIPLAGFSNIRLLSRRIAELEAEGSRA